jgi:hypothetical protein
MALRYGWLFVASTLLFGQTDHQRDISTYETAKPYRIRLLDRDKARKEGEIRKFLWEHWREHRRASLSLTAYSTEGEQSVSNYFIEPGQSGNWQLVVQIDREVVDRGGSGKRWREKVEYTCTALERIEPPHDLLHRLIPIDRDAERRPESYRIHPQCGSERLPQVW